LSEKKLIKHLKKGSEKAYIQLIELYGDQLFRTCYLILKDKEDAEDVVQETLIRVLKNIESFKENSKLYTWIYQIALNLSRDILRKKVDFSSLEDEWVGEEDPQIDIEKKIDAEVLKKSLKELSPIYNEVLVLFYLQEFSIKEISEMLKLSEGTIKSRLSRGRTILKTELQKEASAIG
jgi:RNA polymerase sigma-70 factor (ECF subfamily)